MIYGFTGTQRGLTDGQFVSLAQYVGERPLGRRLTAAIHGGCIGSDDEFDKICAELNIPRIVFPSTVRPKRVPDIVLRARIGSSVTINEPMPPLARNKVIVNRCRKLIICPAEMIEQLRSGTWATFRRAKKMKIPWVLIYPNGKVVESA